MNDSIDARPPPPDLTLGGLRLWVHGRQFPQAQDFWDANWLTVTAQCEAANASVQVRGPIVHTSELDRWCTELAGLANTLTGDARLVCLEPALSVLLKAESMGHIAMEVSITPEHLTQRHWFAFELDQSYLPPLIRQCHTILQTYPIRGSDHRA